MSHDECEMDNQYMRTLFWREYGAVHFMTPTIHDYVQAGKFIGEISSGNGIAPMTWIVGATILECSEIEDGHATKRRHDLSTSFSGHNKYGLIEEARQYIRDLQNEEEQN